MAPRAARLGLALVVAVSLLPLTALVAAPARGGTDAIPDLAVAPLSDFRIQTVGGQRLLRFTTRMVNVGAGHFEVRGRRASTSQPMSIEQWLYPTAAQPPGAPSTIISTPAAAQFAGDGHDHWHVQEMMRYDLWDTSTTARGAKVGFCFLDLERYGASTPPYYTGCGSSPSALGFTMGISVGWADTYYWNIANQWIDVTGLPSGTYTVRARVDPNGFFVETSEVNQCAYATVWFSTSSNEVAVLGSGSECVNDWSGSGFAADIAWLYSTGITTGCAPELFCPARSVSREQMASFLARAFNLPAAGGDFFVDDEASPHAADINRIAQAGITNGCSPGYYCPTALVTREQMAAFLHRAMTD
jgi:hypothetical protein